MEKNPTGWMLTYSDMTTLLLTFFVLIISMSSFDTNKFRTFTKGTYLIGKGGLGIFRVGGSGKVKFLSRKKIMEELRKNSPKAIISTIPDEVEVKETPGFWLLRIPADKVFMKEDGVLPSFYKDMAKISRLMKSVWTSGYRIRFCYPKDGSYPDPEGKILSLFHLFVEREGLPPDRFVLETSPYGGKGEVFIEIRKKALWEVFHG